MVLATVSGVPVNIEIANPVTAQPGGAPVTTASVVGDPEAPARWSTGEFDACDEVVPTCLMSGFCPCFVVAQIAAKIKLFHGSDKESYWLVVCLYAFFYFLAILFLLLKEHVILPGLWFVFTVVVVLVSFFVRISVAKGAKIARPNCYTGRVVPAVCCAVASAPPSRARGSRRAERRAARRRYHFGFTLCSLTQMARQVRLYEGRKCGLALFLPVAGEGDEGAAAAAPSAPPGGGGAAAAV